MNKQKQRILFSKKERRGVYLLSSIFLLITCSYFSLEYIYPTTHEPPLPLDSILVQLVLSPSSDSIPSKNLKKAIQNIKQRKKNKNTKWKSKKPFKKYSFPPIKAFPFDPNTIAGSELKKMKLAPFITKALLNYRNRGGIFRKKEDLKKIYGINDSIYSIIAPYVVFPEVEKAYQSREAISTISFIELNSATAKDLESLHGIGPVLSKRVIKYRDMIGGFHSVSQFNDVYGIEDSIYERVLPLLSVDNSISNKLNINTADIDQLGKHPLISYKLAKVIVNYRKHHGPFEKVEDLINTKVIKPEDLKKIKPYLSIL